MQATLFLEAGSVLLFFTVLSMPTTLKLGEKKTLNEFQYFNVLQVPNCMNLRSLAIWYLLNNSIYFIL